ncbi:MICOS complex subunit MIC27 isoform X2 [Synchiropus splendidus]|nr:MICOS complex subunit MIC27 isoform X2 [Synchiropus splendidus]
MVAVPTVLGFASIRVYTVSQTPTNFQSTREQLNVYTPLPWSTQSHGVSQQPGIIESSVTSARHGVLPFVHAVKGACVSVKKGGINLYHAGQDVYYYLKDPPPGFLPRSGTIAMAGLLGMFLARKGSRLKRLALPLGLMTAGATLCYPAQAVAVFKVTGKTAYAAGRWSSSTVSSLFSSKAPGAPDAAAAALVPVNGSLRHSERQASEVPDTAAAEEAQPAACHASEPSAASEESTQSAEVSKTEAAESLPVSPELIIAAAEETSAQESPDHTLTEALSAETSSPGEDVRLESRSLSEHVSAAVSPDEPTLHLDPETGEVALAEEAPPPTPMQLEAPAIQPEPESSDNSAAAAEVETTTPSHSSPPVEQPGADNSKDGTAFKPDPALMDFGQSNPDDEDLYSTRS